MALVVERIASLAQVEAAAWDALTGPDDPFTEHAFLHGLEASGSVGPGTGWIPCHLLVREDARLVGAMPLYLKDDSYGEYIFDWAWARAAQQARLPYYPKLVSAVPFTPVTGRRLLGGERDEVTQALCRGLLATAEDLDAFGVHVLFAREREQASLERAGFIPRLTHQYHWVNEAGWRSFESFLDALRSPSRKQVRRERRRAGAHGLEITMRTGAEMNDAEWDGLWRFYQDTGRRKWGRPYLERGFFDHLRSSFTHRIRATFAHRDGVPVAGALLFEKGAALYGRYWGSDAHFEDVHFELCYYRPLEHCLAHGLTRFEAGAQGEHKIKRGLLPAPIYSAHLFRHRGFSDAVHQHVAAETQAVRAEMAWLHERTPFRRG